MPAFKFFVIFSMKTIVVPTDFSASAENAMLYAGELAKNINAWVLLVHVFQIPVGMNDMPVLMVSADELKTNADEGLNRAKELLHKNYNGLEIKTESRLGDVTDELNDVCDGVNAFAIVTGKHGATGLERALFGSTSLSIIRQTKYPVIVVPHSSQKQQIKNVSIAVDDLVENLPVQKIKSLVGEMNAKLHLIHVQQSRTGTPDLTHVEKELNTTCTNIYDDEFVHGIETYINQNNVDLLIILPHRHNFMERLFFRTHTAELLKKISIPIMCINDDGNRQS